MELTIRSQLTLASRKQNRFAMAVRWSWALRLDRCSWVGRATTFKSTPCIACASASAVSRLNFRPAFAVSFANDGGSLGFDPGHCARMGAHACAARLGVTTGHDGDQNHRDHRGPGDQAVARGHTTALVVLTRRRVSPLASRTGAGRGVRRWSGVRASSDRGILYRS
jgi:hypothetical protein